ncbi:MAG TPA: hypothetical protein PKA41_02650 [Verrucomicrobiota bacterium]|nr:hypothetical protein [Verrucomicrobiota bacterium]
MLEVTTGNTTSQIIRVTGLSNQEFLSQYARVSCVGLAGGRTVVDVAIARAQRHLSSARRWSRWSHAFLFEGKRADGHHWVIESDLQFHHKHIQLGVQENRATKYHDSDIYTRLAVLDFNLTKEQEAALIREGLELVAARTGYSLRELIGTLIALRHQNLRPNSNLLARDHALFCSAMVRHIFHKSGVDLMPGVEVKNTTPEDIARSPLLAKMYILERDEQPTILEKVDRKLRRVETRIRAARRKFSGNG